MYVYTLVRAMPAVQCLLGRAPGFVFSRLLARQAGEPRRRRAMMYDGDEGGAGESRLGVRDRRVHVWSLVSGVLDGEGVSRDGVGCVLCRQAHAAGVLVRRVGQESEAARSNLVSRTGRSDGLGRPWDAAHAFHISSVEQRGLHVARPCACKRSRCSWP